MAEQILIGQTCHVASDRSDIGFASESTKEGEETRKASKRETRERGNRKRRNFTHIVAGIVISDLWNQSGDKARDVARWPSFVDREGGSGAVTPMQQLCVNDTEDLGQTILVGHGVGSISLFQSCVSFIGPEFPKRCPSSGHSLPPFIRSPCQDLSLPYPNPSIIRTGLGGNLFTVLPCSVSKSCPSQKVMTGEGKVARAPPTFPGSMSRCRSEDYISCCWSPHVFGHALAHLCSRVGCA